MLVLTGLAGKILSVLLAAAAGESVFIESDRGNSAAIIQGDPLGGAAKVEVKRGDDFIVVQRRDDQGNSVTIIQGTGGARD
jgi:hypothetical protein